MNALNVFAILSLAYAFGILPWTKTHRPAGDTDNCVQNPNASSKLCRGANELPRDIGGGGIVDVGAHHRQADSLCAYFYSKEQASPLHAPLNFKNRSFNPLSVVKSDQERMDEWKSKAMHGKYVNCLWQPFVDLHLSKRWLCGGELFAETEDFMCAIHDQKAHHKKMGGERPVQNVWFGVRDVESSHF